MIGICALKVSIVKKECNYCSKGRAINDGNNYIVYKFRDILGRYLDIGKVP
jgi:hypothetical protein